MCFPTLDFFQKLNELCWINIHIPTPLLEVSKDVMSEGPKGKETDQEQFKEQNVALLSVHYGKIPVVWTPPNLFPGYVLGSGVNQKGQGPLVWHWRNNRIVFLQAYQIGATVVNIQKREGGLFRCPTGDRSDPVGPPFELHPRNQSDVLSTADNHLACRVTCLLDDQGRIRAPCGLYSAHRAAPPPYIQPYAGPIIGLESSPCQSLEERLSQDNQIKQRRAWLLLGWVPLSDPVLESSPPARPLVVVRKSPLSRWSPVLSEFCVCKQSWRDLAWTLQARVIFFLKEQAAQSAAQRASIA
ncbi:hypothetical protein J6590_006302 [Homalodisca vitripennis]|nr:hypothetical protein J6590_006302 [Homalodisca vitripennis]